MMGTGWLVRPDLLITAGHVVFDYSYEYRAAVQIKCYIGYDGRNSVGGPTCQPRYGKHVVTTGEWTNEPNRRKDVAFIQVTRPFEGNLNLFSYVDTPESDTTTLSIVGYPGDMSVGGETGAQMYELSKKTKYDLNDNDLHMIKYKISTFGGEYIPR
jgi:V8-like Glu-specific endopeptidase